mmetsp:Transcript_16549/g.32981  ORF Transcript_16549/g.32981 Transcript_16549/m.32981 type:complete len:296 (-) Transcript_16549:230-1117(-)
MWSLSEPALQRALACSAALLWSGLGRMKGSLLPPITLSVASEPPTPSSSPKMTDLAILTSTLRFPRATPRLVRSFSSLVMAPSSTRVSTAFFTARGWGLSMALSRKAGMPVGDSYPPCARLSLLDRIHSDSRGVLRSSDSRNALRLLLRCLETRLKQTPALHLPALPARCCSDAREIHCALSVAVLRCGSYPFSLALALSMTKDMSSMVTLVSAMFVLRTILRAPLGGRRNTSLCSLAGTPECRGRILNLGMVKPLSWSVDERVRISCQPGRKTRTASEGPLTPTMYDITEVMRE